MHTGSTDLSVLSFPHAWKSMCTSPLTALSFHDVETVAYTDNHSYSSPSPFTTLHLLVPCRCHHLTDPHRGCGGVDYCRSCGPGNSGLCHCQHIAFIAPPLPLSNPLFQSLHVPQHYPSPTFTKANTFQFMEVLLWK